MPSTKLKNKPSSDSLQLKVLYGRKEPTMSFRLNKLYTTLTLGGHTLTLGTDHFDTDVTAEAIKKKLEEGVEFSIGNQRLGATLGDIATWIEYFETGLGLPDELKTITGEQALNDVTVVITELSVTFSTKKPKFSIGMEIDFAEHFFKDIGLPKELEKWFRPDNMGISISYAKEDQKELPKAQ
jgi:hypothetical protein